MADVIRGEAWVTRQRDGSITVDFDPPYAQSVLVARDLIEEMARMATGAAERAAEVERLRKEVAVKDSANRYLIEERDAAVERQTVVDAEVERQRTEIARLRSELTDHIFKIERLERVVQAVRDLPVHWVKSNLRFASMTVMQAVVRKADLDAALGGERE